MFSRWNFARLRAAENALHEGRLDDAFDRLVDGLLDNARAKESVRKAALALTARARVATQSGRYRDALYDLDRALRLCPADSEARALRERAAAELQRRQQRHEQTTDATERAAERIRAGRLESGRVAVDQMEDPARREQLREELDIRVQRGLQLLNQAQSALERDELDAACAYWTEACARHGRTRETDAFATRLAERVGTRLREWFDAGRLAPFLATLGGVRSLIERAPRLSEWARLAELTRDAARRVGGGAHARLREVLLRLKSAAPGVAWVQGALASAEKLVAARSELLASPLGAIAEPFVETSENGTAAGATSDENTGAPRTAFADVQDENGAPLDARPLLLLVDGAGSSLILPRDRIRIGRAGADVDVPIPADILSRHAEIVHNGEDYFLVAHGPTRVNRRLVSRKLLRHNDRITLGDSAKMVFLMPSSKSETAVLKLADRCRLAQDVSAVVLFRGTCLLGPHPSCHIRTREGEARAVLFERGGKLYARRVDGAAAPAGRAEALPLAETKDIGDVRVTVKAYEAGKAGGPASA